MFIAKPLCFILFWLIRLARRSPETDNSLPKARLRDKLLFLVPGMCEVAFTTMGFIGLTMTAAGVYQMMTSMIVFWTFLFSAIYLRRKFLWLHYVAIALVISGLALVGLGSIFWANVFYHFHRSLHT